MTEEETDEAVVLLLMMNASSVEWPAIGKLKILIGEHANWFLEY